MVKIYGEELKDITRESLNQMFWETVEKHGSITAVKYKSGDKFVGFDYRELGDKVRKLAQGLMSLGVQKEDKVSLLAQTRWEWVLSDFAILTAGGVTVTIYPTLPPNIIKHICSDSDSVAIIVENQEHLDNVMAVKDELPLLRHIISIEPVSSTEDNVLTVEEVIKKGEEFEKENPGAYKERWQSVQPDDLSSIVYTSGTTGLPKGTMLSHWNWRFNVYSAVQMTHFEEADELLCFLPLAHVYMRIVLFAGVWAGSVNYFSTTDRLAEDLPVVKPRAFVSVPRLFERVNIRLMEQINSGPAVRKSIFLWASDVARQVGQHQSRGLRLPSGLKFKHKLADRLVFSKIKERLGADRLRWTVSAGSALTRDLAFFFNGLGIKIMEGYGMTECAGPSNINPHDKIKPGTVGPPIPGVFEKIAEDGEILMKGDNLMQGYYKLPEETKISFTEDGWLKTGDIGEFDEDGYLVFKERKKHILVLSTGKNVAPLPIEESLKKSVWIDEAMVIGDDRKYVSTLLWPNYQMIIKYAEENTIPYDDSLIEYEEGPGGEQVPISIDPSLLKSEEIIKVIQKEVDEANKDFAVFEQTKKFAMAPRSLSVEKGEITPTLKLKRKEVQKIYQDLIEEMYQS